MAVSTAETIPLIYPMVQVDDEGALFNPSTGELYDLDPEGRIFLEGHGWTAVADIRPDSADPEQAGDPITPFIIEDRGSAEWALGRRAEIEAEAVALQARRDAFLKGIDAQLSALRRKLSWWDFRYESGVIGFARTMLKGKSRTAQLDNGKVSFRTVPGSPQIVDDDAAIEWMKRWAPEKVKVKVWVNATDVVSVRKAADLEFENDRPTVLPFLVISEARESVRITTGVEKGSNHVD
jgi:hypothetical protein